MTAAVTLAALLGAIIPLLIPAPPALAQPGVQPDASPDDLARPDASSVRTDIDRAIETYEAAGCYRLRFTQTNYWSLADSTFVVDATLTVEPPDLLSLRYDDGGRVVASGGTLRVFIPQTQQFFISPIDSTDLVLDPAAILRSYHLHPSRPVVEESDAHVVAQLVPGNRFANPSSMLVTINRELHLVTRLVATAGSGDRSTYEVHSTDLAPSVAPAEFQLTPPPGVAVQRGTPYDHGDLGS